MINRYISARLANFDNKNVKRAIEASGSSVDYRLIASQTMLTERTVERCLSGERVRLETLRKVLNALDLPFTLSYGETHSYEEPPAMFFHNTSGSTYLAAHFDTGTPNRACALRDRLITVDMPVLLEEMSVAAKMPVADTNFDPEDEMGPPEFTGFTPPSASKGIDKLKYREHRR